MGKNGSNGNKSNERDAYQQTLMEFIQCRPVAYWPGLARRVGGVKAAVMLSQLLYWNGDPTVKSRGGWLLKSVDDLEHETGLTKVEQQTARETLIQYGVIDAELRGVPRIWHYRVNMAVLENILIGKESHPMENSSNENLIQWETHSMENLPNIGRESDPTLGRNLTQLNKVLKTTSLRLHKKTTSSSYPAQKNQTEAPQTADQQEQGLPENLISGLSNIGVFEDLYPEIVNALQAGWSVDALLDLIGEVTTSANVTAPGGAFIYRLRNRKPPKPRDDRKNYLSGEYADLINC